MIHLRLSRPIDALPDELGGGAGSALDALLARAAPDRRPVVLHALACAADQGALIAEVLDRDRPVARVLRAPRAVVLEPAPAGPSVLSRFAHLRRDGDRLLVESPRTPSALELLAPEAAAAFVAGTDPELSALARHAGLLVAEGAREPDHWEPHDLRLHVRSRLGVLPVGATWPAAHLPDPPLVRAPWPGPSIALPVPAPLAMPLGEAIEARRSTAVWGPSPPTLEALGHLLHHVLAIRGTNDHGGEPRTVRAYGSGGARYSLEAYLAVAACDGLEPGLYHYDASAHALTCVRPWDLRVQRLVGDGQVGAGPVPVVLVLASRFARVSRKYEGLAYSLVLKEVGGVMHALHLAATGIGLGFRAIGTGRLSAFEAATGLDPLDEASVGEVALGTLPDPKSG